MTQQEFETKIEACLKEFDACLIGVDGAKNIITEVFKEALMPFVASREHLQLFIYRVMQMRKLQKEYFKGNTKQALRESIKAETAVDMAINKLMGDFNYTTGHNVNYLHVVALFYLCYQ